MSRLKILRTYVAIGAFVLISVVAGSMIGRSAAAQPVNTGLRPPFAFHKASNVSTTDVGFPPVGSTVIFTETFGASFAPTTTVGANETMWRVITNTDASNYFWGGVTSGGFEPSAWPAAAQIVPGVSVTYPASLDTWLIYGPLDLSHYASAQLLFDYYLDTTPGACYPTYSGDCLTWAYSYDGQTFYGSDSSGHVSPAIGGSGWLSGSLVLDKTHFRDGPLYIAFAFKGGSSPSGAGAFVRNMQITGDPLKYVYLPLVLNDYTAPPLFGYYFDDAGSDLAHWGGAYYTTTAGIKYGQCIPGQCTVPIAPPYPHGNLTNSLRLYTNALYKMFASSPNDILPNSYDLYVDISPVVFYSRAGCSAYGCPNPDYGNWYGVIFNASSDTFGSGPLQFDFNKKYYRLYFYPRDATRPIAARLDRCDGPDNTKNCVSLGGGEKALPDGFIGNATGWDQVHIVRSGATINIYIDNHLLFTANDNIYTGASYGKYGVFILAWDKNDTGPLSGAQMQVDFDNIKVYAR